MTYWSSVSVSEGSHPAFRPLTASLLLLAFALIGALHLPGAWMQGRFIDEEATVFLAYAWHFPALEALFRPFAGYLNIAANASTVVLAELIKGGSISLERAPYFSMLLGLAFQVAPILMILTGEARWLRSPQVRLASALLVAIAPGTEEVAFNVIHIQFHLALCVALLLTFDVPRSLLARVLAAVALLLAPLCGPAAILLLPLFALRSWLDASWGRGQQTLILAIGSGIQLLFFYGESPIRGLKPDLLTAAAGTFLRVIILPLFGSGFSEKIGEQIAYSQFDGMGITLAVAVCGALVMCGLFVTACWRRSAVTWLLAAGLTLAVASFCVGMASPSRIFVLLPSAGPRYNFLPVVLVGMAIFGSVGEAKKISRTLFLAASAMWLTTSSIAYIRPLKAYAAGPAWPAEVAKWRQHSDYPLRIWASKRVVELPAKPRRCTPTSKPKGDPEAPLYCESGWMVAFWPSAMRGPDEQVRPRWTYPLAPDAEEE
jgi:hypothetical protein